MMIFSLVAGTLYQLGNWSSDDYHFWYDKTFHSLDYSSNDEPEGLVVVNQDLSAG